jgi:hypothetical protein
MNSGSYGLDHSTNGIRVTSSGNSRMFGVSQLRYAVTTKRGLRYELGTEEQT